MTVRVPPTAAQSPFANGAGIGVAQLPHRDPAAAAAFAIGEFDISTVPCLPNAVDMPSGRSSSLAQSVAGIAGVSMRGDRIVTDNGLLSSREPIRAALDDPSFTGLRAFLDLANRISLDGAPVTWHHIGPVTLGVALHDAGLDTAAAFALAVRAVRTQLVEVSEAIAAVLPNSPQLAMLDEPALADLMTAEFPVPPDHAVDMMSSGMAALASQAIVGIQCDLPCDIATMLASGPGVIAVPAHPELVDWAGYLNRFLDDGGVVAWGVVPTEGPIALTAERHWRAVSDLWCELVRRGCDPVALRRQSMVTAGGSLDAHAVSVSRRIARMTADVGKRVKDQANATRFALGA